MKNFDKLITPIEKINFVNIKDMSMIKHMRKNIGIDVNTYASLNKIALSFFKENNLISLKDYRDKIIDYWIAFHTNKANLEQIKTDFSNLYNSKAKNFFIIRSIYGFEDKNIETFEFFNAVLIEKNNLKTYIETKDIDIDISNELVQKNLKTLGDFLILLRLEAITQNRAKELSEEEFEIIENFFNFFAANKAKSIFIITPPYMEHSNHVITLSNNSTSLEVKFGNNPYPMFKFSDIKSKWNKNFDFIFNLFSIINNSDIAQSLFTAINWIGKANAEKDNTIAFTEYVFALECLLYKSSKADIITPSILFQISTKAAFLLISNNDENYIEKRKEISKKFKKIYANRSGIVHGGKTAVEETDIYYIKYYLIKLIEKIINLYNHDKINSHDELTNYINSLMYK